uniref:antithrombin-III n=1 Tax=Myxine glutinosa TaxID=7769 RepID=UPI00358E0B41
MRVVALLVWLLAIHARAEDPTSNPVRASSEGLSGTDISRDDHGLCSYRISDTDKQHPRTSDDVPKTLPDRTNPRVAELSRANAKFSFKLYRSLASRRGPEENVFLSPLSISTSFAMTMLGACGDTLRQIMQVFEFESVTKKTSSQIHMFFSKLNDRLYRKANKSTQLVAANRLFGTKSIVFNPSYQDFSEGHYGAKLLPLNFAEKTNESLFAINNWVAEKTQGKVKNVIPPDGITPETQLVIVNAIFFKGMWKHGFDKYNTYYTDFHPTLDLFCNVSMMEEKGRFRHARLESEGLQILELPYHGDAFSIILLLPTRRYQLEEIEARLSPESINRWIKAMSEQPVFVSLPRFSLEDSFSLKEHLQALGLIDIFSAQDADLSGMLVPDSKHMGLYASDVFHKAFIEVNEAGSEAGAASAIVFLARSSQPNMEEFHADQPFVMLIREVALNSVLFMGRVSHPCN